MEPDPESLDLTSDLLSEKHIPQLSTPEVPLRTILALASGLGGVQVIWSTIFSNGTLYLTSLNSPPTLTALVWSLPALTGCILQPLVGASSDLCTSRWGRRRPYILVGTVGVSVSILVLAWARELGNLGTDLIAEGSSEMAETMGLVCAVLGVAALSVAVQPLQCGLRALILDVCPAGQQAKAQAWVSRLSGVGQVFGCAAGIFGAEDVESTFRVLSVVAVLAVNGTVWVTLLGTREEAVHDDRRDARRCFSLRAMIASLVDVLVHNSWMVRRVLSVQFLAWIGWFAFLFYNTSYILQLRKSISCPVSHALIRVDAGSKSNIEGYLASLVSSAYSCVAFVTVIILPIIIDRSQRADRSYLNFLKMLKLWCLGSTLSAALMFATFVTSDLNMTVVLVSLNGFSWAVNNWVPFALLGQLAAEGSINNSQSPDTSSGGSLMGLHNMAIAGPQILAAFISVGVFWLADALGSHNGAVWMLRFGGLAYLSAAVVIARTLYSCNGWL